MGVVVIKDWCIITDKTFRHSFFEREAEMLWLCDNTNIFCYYKGVELGLASPVSGNPNLVDYLI